MVGTFFGLEVARRALQAQQMGVDVAGHNIANANTPGYSRQISELKSTGAITIQGQGHQFQLGTGVDAETITRARDGFVDRLFRNETALQQYWSENKDALEKIEAALNEPGDHGLSNDLDQFWNAWSDLAKDPTSMPARVALKQSSIGLITSFRQLAQRVRDLQAGLDSKVQLQISQINDYASQIAHLNNQILRAEVGGAIPNDLYDQRDALLDSLAKLVNVRVTEQANGSQQGTTLSVMIGDLTAVPPQVLVDGGNVHLLKDPPDSGGGFATVTWADGQNAGAPDKWGNTISLGDAAGSLLANIEMRGDAQGAQGYAANILNQLNTLTKGVADAVNNLHRQAQDLDGGTGNDFFSSEDSGEITAENIRLNPLIENDLDMIAAATFSSSGVNLGDGSAAASIAAFAEGWSKLGDNQRTLPARSIGNFYAAWVAQIGADVQQSEGQSAERDASVAQLINQREAVSGVSLDEEMVNLVKYQKSYAAAARMVTVMDNLLDTLINGMGTTR